MPFALQAYFCGDCRTMSTPPLPSSLSPDLPRFGPLDGRAPFTAFYALAFYALAFFALAFFAVTLFAGALMLAISSFPPRQWMQLAEPRSAQKQHIARRRTRLRSASARTLTPSERTRTQDSSMTSGSRAP